MKKNFPKITFCLILLLAIISRFYLLGSLPSSLNCDEVSHAYNAYSLLKTGKDQWGVPWPIFNFRAYGDYPTTANLYLTIPFIKIFGLNAFSVRLPHAILGTVFVVLMYFFCQNQFSNYFISFTSMFLAAISPWLVFPSRAVFQSNLSQTFLLAGIYFFYLSLKSPKQIFFSSLFFSLALFSYHNTRIIIPLLVPLLVIYYRPQITPMHRLALIIFLLFLIPNLINFLNPQSLARNRWVGILNESSQNLINDQRFHFSGPKLLNLFINNKYVYFSKKLFLNYLNLLNPLPLFFLGSNNYQFNPPKTGLFFSILLPFFYLGFFVCIKKKPILFFLFLLSLLPAALTVGDFPSIRATTALPFYLIFLSYGLNLFNRRFVYLLILPLVFYHLFLYWQIYFKYNIDYSYAWQGGYQELVAYLKTIYSDFDHIYLTKKYGEPHEFILFYWPWDPKTYHTDLNFRWDYHSNWYWVDSFDKFIFFNNWELPQLQLQANSLLIAGPDFQPQPPLRHLKTINLFRSLPAFNVYRYD